MDAGMAGLLLGAAILGLTHTALGPDHTLPFIMLARARRWSLRKTLRVTLWCGVGHVLAALALVGLGFAVSRALSGLPAYRGWLETFETGRGTLAGWGCVGLGLAYGLWGARHAVRRGAGLEPHEHGGRVHIHVHGGRGHRHGSVERSQTTFWMLFALLVLGPCEPLIVLFLPLAVLGRWGAMAAAGVAFSAATLATMVAIVAAVHVGLMRLPLGSLERWSHAMAGGVIACAGLGVVFLGL